MSTCTANVRAYLHTLEKQRKTLQIRFLVLAVKSTVASLVSSAEVKGCTRERRWARGVRKGSRGVPLGTC